MTDKSELQAIVNRLGINAEVPPSASPISIGRHALPEDFLRFCKSKPDLIKTINNSPYILAGLGFLSPFGSPSALEERNVELREDSDWHDQLVSFYQGDDGDYCFFYRSDNDSPTVVYIDLWGPLEALPEVGEFESKNFSEWLEHFINWLKGLGHC